MTIFVAGATGVLGRRVVSGLAAAGNHVIGLSRSGANDTLLRSLGAEPRRGDLFDRDEIAQVSKDCAIILHLATAIPKKARPGRKDWNLNDRIRREGTTNLVHAALRNNVRLYVQQSVTFLYGDRAGEWVDEETPVADHQPFPLRSAVDMERMVVDAVTRDRLPGIILRFGSFYSADSSQTSSMFRAISERRFPIIGGGDSYWNIINADDAAAAVVLAVDVEGNRKGIIFNVCDDEPVLYRDYVNDIAGNMKAGKPRRLPVLIAKLAVGPDLVDLLLASVRCRNNRAKKELGWKPVFRTYREGIPRELEQWSRSRTQRTQDRDRS